VKNGLIYNQCVVIFVKLEDVREMQMVDKEVLIINSLIMG